MDGVVLDGSRKNANGWRSGGLRLLLVAVSGAEIVRGMGRGRATNQCVPRSRDSRRNDRRYPARYSEISFGGARLRRGRAIGEVVQVATRKSYRSLRPEARHRRAKRSLIVSRLGSTWVLCGAGETRPIHTLLRISTLSAPRGRRPQIPLSGTSKPFR